MGNFTVPISIKAKGLMERLSLNIMEATEMEMEGMVTTENQREMILLT